MLDTNREVLRLETFVSSPQKSHNFFTVVLTVQSTKAGWLVTPMSTQFSRLDASLTDKTLLYWTTRLGRLEMNFLLPPQQPGDPSEGLELVKQHYRHQVEKLYEKVSWQSGVEITLTGLFTVAKTKECTIWRSGRRITAHAID